MNCFDYKHPVTILYHGDLFDTATIVGFALMKVPIGEIAFTGPLSPALKQYVDQVNEWLASNRLPKVQLNPDFDKLNLSRIQSRSYRDWGWGDSECRAALHLVGLPLPPVHAA